MHGLEQIGRSFGDQRDAIGQLQALPGIPGTERKSAHNAESRGQDDCLQQRGNSQAIQHDKPPKVRPLRQKRVNI
jgi:hypothetical protein